MAHDVWEAGDPYEAYVGRWSRLVAIRFLDLLAVPDQAAWLDVGCGTGALASTVLARRSPSRVLGVDPSEGFLASARSRLDDPRVSLAVGDAAALPVADGEFDAVVSGLCLNFVPAAARAVAEMARVASADAVVAAYVWDYAEGMELMRHFWDAAADLDPAATELDEGRRFGLCRPEPLRALWSGAGLVEIAVDPVDLPTTFTDFADYWSPFLGGQGSGPGYAMSLTAEHRARLREELRSRLPVEADGSIRLHARAWAVRGRRVR